VPADQFSCLVIDYKLPDIDGMDLARRLRGAGVTAPMILITSNPDARCRARAARDGAVIVEKPLLGDRLLREIRTLTEPALRSRAQSPRGYTDNRSRIHCRRLFGRVGAGGPDAGLPGRGSAGLRTGGFMAPYFDGRLSAALMPVKATLAGIGHP